jgi:hypothetical protein
MILVLGSYEHHYGLDGLIESAIRPEYRELARQFWQDYKVSIDPGKLPPDSTDLRVTGFFEYFTDERNSAFIRQMEQAHRPAMDNHVHRPPRLGASVLVNEPWYKLLRVKSAAKTGFETAIPLPDGGSYFQIEAIDAKGMVIGKSKIVTINK